MDTVQSVYEMMTGTVQSASEMVMGMDRCARDRSRCILCVNDDEDLGLKDCYCVKDLGRNMFPGQGLEEVVDLSFLRGLA